jgi:hypothetical protein
MKEVWTDIKGYEGLYQVSNFGRVKSFPRNGARSNQPQIMAQVKTAKGYMVVCLSKDGKKHSFRTHRLVAETFIPNYANSSQVNHKDENKQNNRVDNLEWCDCSYNNCYNNRMKKIALKIGKKVRCLETNVVYNSVSEAARSTGISYSGIVYACQGKFKQIKGYHFKYEGY